MLTSSLEANAQALLSCIRRQSDIISPHLHPRLLMLLALEILSHYCRNPLTFAKRLYHTAPSYRPRSDPAVPSRGPSSNLLSSPHVPWHHDSINTLALRHGLHSDSHLGVRVRMMPLMLTGNSHRHLPLPVHVCPVASPPFSTTPTPRIGLQLSQDSSKV